MTTPHTCPKCGAQLPADSPEGLCPPCLMSGGFDTDATVKMTPSQKPAPSQPAQTPTPQELAPLFPNLEIIGLLGRGGMGAVYKARQKNLNRLVALKILPAEAGADPHFAERFQREAQALARLNHPNIVTVFEVGVSNGLFYFLMEFVDGANLRTLIRGGEMKPEAALALIPAFCDALQYAHDEGVVHRDIKPENVLVDKKGRVKIADFGLAKLLGQDAHEHTLTRTGMYLGTPRYMAPEQVDKPETVDHRADIYSLGVVFYEMLTGEIPMGRFAPPSQKVQIDVRLDEIVLHALERDADRRYQHASEVRDDVEKVTGKPQDAPSVAAASSGSAARKREIAISLILMLAIFGVCYGLQGVIRTTVFTIVDNSRGTLDATTRTFELMKFTFFLSGAASAMGLTILGHRRGNDRLLRICALVVATLGVFVPGDLIIHLCGLAGAGIAGWCWYALCKPVVKAPSPAVEAGDKPQTRHLLSAFLVLLFGIAFLFGVSYHAKVTGTTAGLTTLITVGALDPLFVIERGTSGAQASFNPFTWSFLAVVVAGMAFSAMLRVCREDQGKVPRDPSWWRDWFKQAGIWGGLLLAVCIVRTVMNPEEILRLPTERTVRDQFNKVRDIFSSSRELSIRTDPSRIPATRTPGRTDYAYAFTVPANHRLFVWLEWWKDGKRTIDQSFNTGLVAKPGQRYDAGVQLVFTDGNVAGPTTAGQTRIDWIVYDPTGHASSGDWRPDFFAGLAQSSSWGMKSSWSPKVNETVTLLEIGAGKDSVLSGPITDEGLRAGDWEAAMLLKARIEPVPESRMFPAPQTKMNAWRETGLDPTPALLRLAEQFGDKPGPFTTAEDVRSWLKARFKQSVEDRAKAEAMLKSAGTPVTKETKPEDVLKALEMAAETAGR